MSERPDQYGLGSFQGTGVGTSAGVTVTQAAAAGKIQVVTGIQCSGDAACVVTIESPSGTVLWKARQGGAFTQNNNFGFSPIQGAVGQAILVKVSASTSNSEASLQGYTKT